jgi:hypothetical protein
VPGHAVWFASDRERDRIAAVSGRQPAVQHRRDRPGIARPGIRIARPGTGVVQENLQPRSPVVIGGPLGIEAQDFGARSEECRIHPGDDAVCAGSGQLIFRAAVATTAV